MAIDKLIKKLSQYGTPQIVKEGVVFTVVITGSGLTKQKAVIEIQQAVIEFVGDRFPFIEALKNEENFFCMILKPNKKSEPLKPHY